MVIKRNYEVVKRFRRDNFKYLFVTWVTQLQFQKQPRPEMFLRKGVLKIFSKFTGEHPCKSAVSIKLLSNFIEIELWHGCSPVNLLHIFRTYFLKNTSGWLLLSFQPKVVFHIETIDLICNANQVTDFYMECYTGLKYVRCLSTR